MSVKPVAPRTSVIFMDGDVVKVVFGRSVREIPSENLPKEKSFLERLFQDYRVVVVEKAVEVTLAQLLDDSPKQQEATPRTQAEPPKQKQPERRQEVGNGKRDPRSDSGSWIRSTSRTTIIIDDLPTGTEVAPGVPLMFSVPHDRAVSMAALKPESIEKSNILKRLLSNGTLEWVSPSEASRLEGEHATRVEEENDARLQQWAPILDGVSAVEYASNTSKRVSMLDDQRDSRDPEPVDVDPDAPSEQEELASMLPSNRGPEVPEERPQQQQQKTKAITTMSELLSEIDEAEKDGTARKQVSRRKVTNAAVVEGANPRGISRRK